MVLLERNIDAMLVLTVMVNELMSASGMMFTAVIAHCMEVSDRLLFMMVRLVKRTVVNIMVLNTVAS